MDIPDDFVAEENDFNKNSLSLACQASISRNILTICFEALALALK